MKIKKGILIWMICICSIVDTVLIRQFNVEEWQEDAPVIADEIADAYTKKIDEPEQLYARSAVLMDADSGRVLFGKDAEERLPMASTTKIMTCILALEYMEDDQIVNVSEYAAGQPKVHLGVQAGESFYIRDLLYSLMLESHNDSAVVIAEGIGGDMAGFAKMMNEKAAQLGCDNTHFVTPNGLDQEDEQGAHLTTAADLARIMKYCVMDSPQKSTFLDITSTRTYTFSDVSGARSYTCTNHNVLLDSMEGAISGKTGFTGKAGYCYVGAVRRDDRTLIVSLLACGWPGNKNYKWIDCRTLLEYGFQAYHYEQVKCDMPEIEVPVLEGVHPVGDDRRSGVGREVFLRAGLKDHDQKLSILKRSDETIQKGVSIKKSVEAPIFKGESIGTLNLKIGTFPIKQYEIVALESVEQKSLLWCWKAVLWQYLNFNKSIL